MLAARARINVKRQRLAKKRVRNFPTSLPYFIGFFRRATLSAFCVAGIVLDVPASPSRRYDFVICAKSPATAAERNTASRSEVKHVETFERELSLFSSNLRDLSRDSRSCLRTNGQTKSKSFSLRN